MKTIIKDSERITKEMVYENLTNASKLSMEEENEWLDILSAILNDEAVYNLTTNKGDFLLFVKGEAITNTTKKINKKKITT